MISSSAKARHGLHHHWWRPGGPDGCQRAPAPPPVPESGSQKGSNKSTEVALSPATKPVSSSGPSTARTHPVEEQEKRKTHSIYDRRVSEHQAAAAVPDEVAPDDVSPSISAKHLRQRSAAELKPKQTPKRHSDPDSSKIAVVTQEADAHRSNVWWG